jgi:TonB family protein
MSENPPLHFSSDMPDQGNSQHLSGESPSRKVERSLFRDKRFRWAWGISFFLHVVIFGAAAWSPSSADYRFYGSGTAVSLVGADEIPGGSARGKSGDRPEDVQTSPARGGRNIKKVTTPTKKKAKRKIKRTKKKPSSKKKSRKLAIKKKKKKISKSRQARLKRIKVRRERLKKWRRKQAKQKKVVKEVKPAPAKKPGKSSGGNRKQVLAKNTAGEPPKPKTGYPGEGGGDGQGGGSLGGGSGGVARNDIERYYGLLAERVRNFWTVPPNLPNLESLKVVVIFDVARDGEMRNLRIETTSGNRIYDTAALRAVKRSADPALPAPPNSVKETWLPLGFRFCGRNFCR